MIAILTGDIINSEHYNVSDWMSILKEYFLQLGSTPQVWEIYRGDEFQIKVAAVDALEVAIAIKAKIKTIKGLDVRMGIGLGEEDFVGTSVSESNGTAYQFSGRIFEKKRHPLSRVVLSAILRPSVPPCLNPLVLCSTRLGWG